MDTLAAFARRRMSFANVFVAFFIIQKNYKYIDFNAFLHLPSLSARRCNSAMFCSTYSCTFAGHLPLSYMASRYSAGTSLLLRPCSCRTAYGRPSSASDRQPRCPCVARWRACAPQCTALHFPNICRSHGAIAGNRRGRPTWDAPCICRMAWRWCLSAST